MVIIKDRPSLKGNLKPSLVLNTSTTCKCLPLQDLHGGSIKIKKKNKKKRATEVLLFFESELPLGTHVGSFFIYEKLMT